MPCARTAGSGRGDECGSCDCGGRAEGRTVGAEHADDAGDGVGRVVAALVAQVAGGLEHKLAQSLAEAGVRLVTGIGRVRQDEGRLERREWLLPLLGRLAERQQSMRISTRPAASRLDAADAPLVRDDGATRLARRVLEVERVQGLSGEDDGQR
jgi:hypothetical protein